MMVGAEKQTHNPLPHLSSPLVENRNPLVSKLTRIAIGHAVYLFKVCLAGFLWDRQIFGQLSYC
jgi:hypothetical protein